jgi:hypothetical protein
MDRNKLDKVIERKIQEDIIIQRNTELEKHEIAQLDKNLNGIKSNLDDLKGIYANSFRKVVSETNNQKPIKEINEISEIKRNNLIVELSDDEIYENEELKNINENLINNLNEKETLISNIKSENSKK